MDSNNQSVEGGYERQKEEQKPFLKRRRRQGFLRPVSKQPSDGRCGEHTDTCRDKSVHQSEAYLECLKNQDGIYGTRQSERTENKMVSSDRTVLARKLCISGSSLPQREHSTDFSYSYSGSTITEIEETPDPQEVHLPVSALDELVAEPRPTSTSSVKQQRDETDDSMGEESVQLILPGCKQSKVGHNFNSSNKTSGKPKDGKNKRKFENCGKRKKGRRSGGKGRPTQRAGKIKEQVLELEKLHDITLGCQQAICKQKKHSLKDQKKDIEKEVDSVTTAVKSSSENTRVEDVLTDNIPNCSLQQSDLMTVPVERDKYRHNTQNTRGCKILKTSGSAFLSIFILISGWYLNTSHTNEQVPCRRSLDKYYVSKVIRQVVMSENRKVAHQVASEFYDVPCPNYCICYPIEPADQPGQSSPVSVSTTSVTSTVTTIQSGQRSSVSVATTSVRNTVPTSDSQEQTPIGPPPDPMTAELVRLRSFCLYRGEGSAVRLARNGFYFIMLHGSYVTTQCYSCHVIVSDWQFLDNIPERHRQLSRNCRHALGIDGRNIPMFDVAQTQQDQNRYNYQVTINREQAITATQRCRHIYELQFEDLQNRIGSFLGQSATAGRWPQHLFHMISALALAGFYYFEYPDFVRCFICGGELWHWQDWQDPVLYHILHFPSCEYMCHLMGNHYVQAIIAQRGTYTNHTYNGPVERGCSEEFSPGNTVQALPQPAGISLPQDTARSDASHSLLFIAAFNSDQEDDEELLGAVGGQSGNTIQPLPQPAGISLPQDTATAFNSDQEDDEELLGAVGGQSGNTIQPLPQPAGISLPQDTATAFNSDQEDDEELLGAVGGQSGNTIQPLPQPAGISLPQDTARSDASHSLLFIAAFNSDQEDDEELLGAVGGQSADHQYIDVNINKCKVCLDQNCCMVFEPCKHICCCRDCAERVSTCPVCRTNIKKKTPRYEVIC